MMSSIQYPVLSPNNETRIYYLDETTPLVNRYQFYVYRDNETFLGILRRALGRILIALCLGFSFIILLFWFMQIMSINEDSNTYFLFTKRWPAAECKDSSKCIANIDQYNRWLIHGLWPEFTNNTWDQYCSKNLFNETKVEALKSDLLKNWPNLLHGKSDNSLWAHEWNKHGTCSKLSQFDYFARTLSLHNRLNVDQWLSDAGILPSTSRMYSLSEFKNAIGSHIDNADVAFNCDRHNGEYYLKEIYLCISFEDTKTLVPCTVESTCYNSFYYIPMKS